MDRALKHQIEKWAAKYNTSDFIADDPVQFPHRFKQMKKQDMEISGFLTAWIAYGKRSLILRKADELHELLHNDPYRFIMDGPESFREIRERAERPGSRNTFYRYYTYGDLLMMCERLHEVYSRYTSMEEALIGEFPDNDQHPVKKIQLLFAGIRGIPLVSGTSACKKLCMFIRWMVRCDGKVDLGIWQRLMKASDLVIPLDVHVQNISKELQLIPEKRTASWKTAVEITEALKEVFPDDPCLGDFALFGYDEDRSN